MQWLLTGQFCLFFYRQCVKYLGYQNKLRCSFHSSGACSVVHISQLGSADVIRGLWEVNRGSRRGWKTFFLSFLLHAMSVLAMTNSDQAALSVLLEVIQLHAVYMLIWLSLFSVFDGRQERLLIIGVCWIVPRDGG